MILGKTYRGNTEIEKIYRGANVIYEAGGFDSGLILNGTFDDASDLILEPAWSVSGGVAVFDSTSTSRLTWYLSEDLVNGSDYEMTFDILNAVGIARFEVYTRDSVSGNNTIVAAFANFSNGTSQTIQFTCSNIDRDQLRIRASSSTGDAFEIDNVSLKLN